MRVGYGLLGAMSPFGRFSPLPIPTTLVDREDVERQVTGENTSYMLS